MDARQAEKARMKQVRAIAARIRAGKPPAAPAELLRRAEVYLRNRAKYNARRAQVRALAAAVRAGQKPRAPTDLLAAVERHLAYRRWYNEARRKGASSGRPAPAATGASRVRRRPAPNR